MKKGVKNLIRAVSFFAVLLLSVVSFSYMLAPKDNTKEAGMVNPGAYGFYSEPKNTIDIAVIGNSDVCNGFSPMELWKNYGYTSYVSGGPWQTAAEAYVMLNDILKCHKPKVVMLETDGFFTNSGKFKSAAKMINASLDSCFSVFQYHDRWKSVKPDELLKKPRFTAHSAVKGQWLSNDVKGYMGGEYMVKSKEKAEIPLAARIAANAFIRTCCVNDIKVVLLQMPLSSWNYRKHNAVKDFVDAHDVPFIDMNIERARFDFNWKTDTRDGGIHLNNRGARKCTMFLGDYLSRNYELTDRRTDKSFSLWNKDYEEYRKKVKI